MSPAFSLFLPTSCCTALQCPVPLPAKLNVDGHVYSPRCGVWCVFTKAIPIQSGRLTKVSSWSSFELHGSCCGEIVVGEEIFVDWCRSGWGIRTAGCTLVSLCQKHGDLQQWYLCYWGFCKPLTAFHMGFIEQWLWGAMEASEVSGFPTCRRRHFMFPRWVEGVNE